MNSLFYKKYIKYKNKYLLLKTSLIGGRYKCNPTALLTKDICEVNDEGEYEKLEDCTIDCTKKISSLQVQQYHTPLIPSQKTSDVDFFKPLLLTFKYFEKPRIESGIESGIKSDYSTPLPLEIIQDAIRLNIFEHGIPLEIDSLQLRGYFFHGIKQRVITLMQILQSDEIGSQNYKSSKGLIVPGIKSFYETNEKNYISFGIMYHTLNMSTYCYNSIFFINKNPSKALELREGRQIGIKSHMAHEYYLKNFLSLEHLILCIDSRLAEKKISELQSPFVEHKYFTEDKKLEIIGNIQSFFVKEFCKLSREPEIILDLRPLVSDEKIFKDFYIKNLLTLVKYMKASLNSILTGEDLIIYDITIEQFIKLLRRYYKKDIKILKVIFS
jgi:hypothetical protein